MTSTTPRSLPTVSVNTTGGNRHIVAVLPFTSEPEVICTDNKVFVQRRGHYIEETFGVAQSTGKGTAIRLETSDGRYVGPAIITSKTGLPGVARWGDRIFSHHAGNVYREVFFAVALDPETYQPGVILL